MRTRTVVVIGHGMGGHRFVEALRSRDTGGAWRIVVLGDEADAAYDRVGLSSYVGAWDRSQLALTGNDYAGDALVDLRLGHAVTGIDRDAKRVNVADGSTVDAETRAAVQRAASQTRIGLVTSAFRIEVEPVLAKTGLRALFEVIVSLDDIVNGEADVPWRSCDGRLCSARPRSPHHQLGDCL